MADKRFLALMAKQRRKAEHADEMAARNARRATRPGGNYDRATARSVVRSVRRQMAGRWNGKMVRIEA
jgi:hypothetical protein